MAGQRHASIVVHGRRRLSLSICVMSRRGRVRQYKLNDGRSVSRWGSLKVPDLRRARPTNFESTAIAVGHRDYIGRRVPHYLARRHRFADNAQSEVSIDCDPLQKASPPQSSTRLLSSTRRLARPPDLTVAKAPRASSGSR